VLSVSIYVTFGYTRHSVRKKIGIRTVNKKKGIAWCRCNLHWTVGNQWKKVIFTDEMMIVIKSDGKLNVWRKSEVWRPECPGYVAEAPSTNHTFSIGLKSGDCAGQFSCVS
jgi:hypothetical protein